MEKVLNILCEIEERANVILNNASNKKAALNQQLTEDMEALDRQYASETEAKLRELREKMEKEIADEHSALVTSCETRLKNLDVNFENNREAYAQAIFHNIIQEQE